MQQIWIRLYSIIKRIELHLDMNFFQKMYWKAKWYKYEFCWEEFDILEILEKIKSTRKLIKIGSSLNIMKYIQFWSYKFNN